MSTISGVILRISPELRMTLGPADDESNEKEYIALTKSSIKKKQILSLNGCFTFSNLQKCLWRLPNSTNTETNVMDSASLSQRKTYWYVGDDSCEIIPADRDATKSSSLYKNLSSATLEDGAENRFDLISNTELFQPSSPYLRSIMSSREITVRGIVTMLNPLGWIEVLLQYPSLPADATRTVNVFIIHYRRSDTTDKLKKGTAIRISFVVPIYLWGKFNGFAATVRSHIEIISPSFISLQGQHSQREESSITSSSRKRIRDHSSIHVSSKSRNYHSSANINFRDSSSNQEDTSSGDCDGIRIADTAECRSSYDRTNDADTTQSEVPAPPARLNVPAALKARCHTYAAWRAYVRRQYVRCVSHTSPSSPCSIGSQKSNNRILSTCPELTDDILRDIEEWNETLYKRDEYGEFESSSSSSGGSATGSSKVDSFRSVRHSNSSSSCNVSASRSSTSNTDGSCRNSTNSDSNLFTCSSNSSANSGMGYTTRPYPLPSGPLSLPALTFLPPDRSVQVEFMDGHYTELYSVRAGHDMDWLSGLMHKVYSSSDVISLGGRLVRDIDPDSASSNGKGKGNGSERSRSDAANRSNNQNNDCSSSSSSSISKKNGQNNASSSSSNKFWGSSAISQAIEGSEWAVHTVRMADAVRSLESGTEAVSDLSVIIGSAVAIEVNEEETFAAIKLYDSRGKTVNLLVTGGLNELLSRFTVLSKEDGGNSRDSRNRDGSISCTGIVVLAFQTHLLLEMSPLPSERGLSSLSVVAEAKNIRLHRLQPPPHNVTPPVPPTSSLPPPTPVPLPPSPLRIASLLKRSFDWSPYNPINDTPRPLTAAHSYPTNTGYTAHSIGVSSSSSGSSSTMSVREVLLCALGPMGWSSGKVLHSVRGVVVYKSLLANDNDALNPQKAPHKGSQDGYRGFCQKQEEDYQKNVRYRVKEDSPRRCKLVLRDEKYGDIVALYAPVSTAGVCVVGMCVVAHDVAMHLASSLRNLYLKDSRNMTIGVLGVVSLPQLVCVAARSQTAPRASNPDTHTGYITPSPRSLISRLLCTRVDNRALWTVLGKVAFVKKVCVRLKCNLCFSEVKDGTPGFLCWNCGSRSTLQPSWNASVLFDDGTGECLVYAEGISVLGLLRQTDTSFSALKDRVEDGCLQYGTVRYDSYFSHWNRMDAINNTQHDDEAHCISTTEGDTEHQHFPPPPITHAKTNNTYTKNNQKNSKTEPFLSENFYRVLSPAHKVEKELETYLNKNRSGGNFKLQVKIISEKIEVPILKKVPETASFGSSSSPNGRSCGDTKNNDDVSQQFGSTLTAGDSILVTAVDDVGNENSKVKGEGSKESMSTLENLLHSVSHCDDVTHLTARNIKVQENNDQRTYSISFLPVPTLNSKILALEAVSVIFMGANEIREEAWKELRALQCKADSTRLMGRQI